MGRALMGGARTGEWAALIGPRVVGGVARGLSERRHPRLGAWCSSTAAAIGREKLEEFAGTARMLQ